MGSLRLTQCTYSRRQHFCDTPRKQRGKLQRQRNFSPKCLSTTFTDSNGNVIKSDKTNITVGKAKDADIQISGPNSHEHHAEIRRSSSRTTCTALVGDEDDLLGDTFTWLDGNQLRTGVGYLLDPASTLSFGQIENEFRIDFEQTNADTSTMEMLIKGMAAQSSQEVRDQFDL